MNSKISAVFLAPAAAACGLWLVGCSPGETKSAAPAVQATNIVLTPAQRQSVHLHTVAGSKFRRTITTTGTVAFDADRATTVLAPISGPASKLLVALGASVARDEPLALIASPDYAAAVSAYRKGVVT